MRNSLLLNEEQINKFCLEYKSNGLLNQFEMN